MYSLKTGMFIKKARERLKLTQRELGEKFSVTDKAVSKWERGLAYPDVEILKEMAILFGCSMKDILNGVVEGEEIPYTSQSSFSASDRTYTAAELPDEKSLDEDKEKTLRRCLILADKPSDFTEVLETCGAAVDRIPIADALSLRLDDYDAFCILADGAVLDPRLRVRLETENNKGKRIFAEALNSWGGIYSADPVDTTRSRLAVVAGEGDDGIPGLAVGDLLDDQSNRMMQPYYGVPDLKPLLVYRDHIIAHRHWNAEREEILKNSRLGLFTIGDSVMMCTFELHNFSRARFAPRKSWETLIRYIAHWLTGAETFVMPEPTVHHDFDTDLTDDAVFESFRWDAVERGIGWLNRFLIDGGRGGIKEGLRHNIDPDGHQTTANSVRTDCCGEALGAFRFYAALTGGEAYDGIADNLADFVLGPMQVQGGMFDGMLRWTDTAWQVCYQDDVARALLPMLYDCLLFGHKKRFDDICRALDFLVRTTAKDGCRVSRTDAPNLTEDGIRALREAEHGAPSAHYNAYYHAALLLAYRIGGNQTYLDVARRGLETIMNAYPLTQREQSETEEMCRLILPLAALYDCTHDARHLSMLDRVTSDLEAHRHPAGGFCEWDTGYKANCSRESRGECSLLTENGDPIADLLYSTNWLPIGFAYAYHVTGDEKFRDLWRNTVAFCIRAQIRSDDATVDGSWCRAFDMELEEIYSCPHDVGWAACCSETGWTDAEILMGLMMPALLEAAQQ